MLEYLTDESRDIKKSVLVSFKQPRLDLVDKRWVIV